MIPGEDGGMRTFRFLADAALGCEDGKTVAANARRAESMGYAGLVLPDHLLEQHAPVPLLATVAAVTEHIRIGTFVLNSQLRHPAVLAQELASLDVLSGGRLEIGLGAGWNKPEHDAIGLPFDPVGRRIERLAEVLAVLKGCFADGPCSYEGQFFTLRDHDGQPLPAQRPHPPFFLGGGGRRLLTLAGREAQIVGLAPRLLPGPRLDAPSITAAAADEKVAWIRAAAGDRFAEIELNTYPSGAPAQITNDAKAIATERAARISASTGQEITAAELLDSPHVFLGTVQALTDKIVGLRERYGITSIMTGGLDDLAPVVESLAGR
jgi:probable F420-dependent oxidoreductase